MVDNRDTDGPEAQIATNLSAIRFELKRLNYWQPSPPSPQALASRMPFAADTLSYPEWLQWLFLPRLRALLDAGGTLPFASAIHVQFDLWALENKAERGELDALLQSLDALLNEHLVDGDSVPTPSRH